MYAYDKYGENLFVGDEIVYLFDERVYIIEDIFHKTLIGIETDKDISKLVLLGPRTGKTMSVLSNQVRFYRKPSKSQIEDKYFYRI